jgi:hypothetical protein
MRDGVTIETDEVYTTGLINYIYGDFGDPCFDDFYTNDTGAYRDAMEVVASNYGGITFLQLLQVMMGR